MEVQRSWLFQLEDGGNLSFAVHDEVPYRERLCESILQNGGALLDWQAADFVILSTSIPGFDELAAFLTEQDKIVVHDHWVRGSIEAQRVLPWYEDQVLPNTAKADTSEASRDLHELVVTLARYSPILSEDAVYSYLARRSPHKSSRDFRTLHQSKQAEVDSQVMYLRFRINSALSSSGTFVKRPKMGFTIPSIPRLSPIRAPIAALQAAASMPTPTSLVHPSTIERRQSAAYQSPPQDRMESPCPLPNLERTPVEEQQEQVVQQQDIVRSPSAEPLQPLRPLSGRISKQTKTRNEIGEPQTVKSPKPTNSKKNIRYPGEKVIDLRPVPLRTSNKVGRLITQEDKWAMAEYLNKRSRKGESAHAFWSRFAKNYARGNLRTVFAWEAGWRRHAIELTNMQQRLARHKKKRTIDDLKSLSSLDTNLGL